MLILFTALGLSIVLIVIGLCLAIKPDRENASFAVFWAGWLMFMALLIGALIWWVGS